MNALIAMHPCRPTTRRSGNACGVATPPCLICVPSVARCRPLRLLKCRVERPAAGGEILRPHEATSLARAEFALHAAVFPFDRKRPVVLSDVQGPDDLLEVHAAAARTA